MRYVYQLKKKQHSIKFNTFLNAQCVIVLNIVAKVYRVGKSSSVIQNKK